MTTVWKKIRIKTGIPTVEIARQMHVDHAKYLEIEEGLRLMPKNIIDKFLSLYNKKKEMKGDFRFKMIEVNQFIKNADFDKLKHDFGYDSYKELAKAIGIHQSTFSCMKNNSRKMGDTCKLKVFNFFNDELNKKTKTSKNIHVANDVVLTKTSDVLRYTLDGRLDLDYIKSELQLSASEICKQAGLHPSCWSTWKRGKNSISQSSLDKIEQLLIDKQLNNQCECIANDNCKVIVDDTFDVVENTDDYTEKEINIKTVDLKDLEIIELNNTIKRLEKTISCYEKLIERL